MSIEKNNFPEKIQASITKNGHKINFLIKTNSKGKILNEEELELLLLQEKQRQEQQELSKKIK